MGGVKYKFMKKKPFSTNDRSLLIFTSNRSFLTNCICLAVIVCFYFLLSTYGFIWTFSITSADRAHHCPHGCALVNLNTR